MAPTKIFVLFSLLVCIKLCFAYTSSPFDAEQPMPPLVKTIGDDDEDTYHGGSEGSDHDGVLIRSNTPSPLCQQPGGGGCGCICYTGFHKGCELIAVPIYSQCPFGFGNCWLISCPGCPVCGMIPIVPSPLKQGKCPLGTIDESIKPGGGQ